MDGSRSESMHAALEMWRGRLDEPWLIAVWPGMGSVAWLAGMHLARQLGAQPIVDLMSDAFEPLAVQVESGLIKPAPAPRYSLSGWRHPSGGRDLVLFRSDTQPQQPGTRIGQRLIEVARTLGIVRICTFAAMATLIDPLSVPRVFAAATDKALLDEVRKLDAVPLADGSIGGLNGSLVGLAGERGFDAMCLLGEMPYYATGIANPKAAAAVVRMFARMAHIEVNMSALDADAAAVEPHLLQLQKRVEQGAIALEAAASDESESTAYVPEPSVQRTKKRIDRLFDVVRRDRSRAPLLKAELDRYGLFPEYEDRFLDLFKRAE